MNAVLADARSRGYDRAVCLGDLVGYGAHPNEVIERVRDLAPWRMVRGNHDKAACGVTDGDAFNDAAREAILWTRQALSTGNRDYLLGLPEGPLEAGGLLLSHGSPLDEEDYIMGDSDAVAVLAQAFPGREIVPVPCRSLIWQNGSLHCVTMQLPQGVV